MISARSIVAAMLFATTCIKALGDNWGPPKPFEVNSSNSQFVVRIAPQKDWGKNKHRCRATLFQVNNGVHLKRWSRYLVNPVSPVTAFVSDNGSWVVTMDEHGALGERPIVVYDKDGDMTGEYTIDSLKIDDIESELSRSISSYDWNENSISFFGPDEKLFYIRLKTRQILVINLMSGRMVSFGSISNTQRQFYNERVKSKVRGYLHSKDANDRQTGAIVAGQENLVAMKPLLRTLLEDDAYILVGSGRRIVWYREYFVRKAAFEALKTLDEHHPDIQISIKDPDLNKPRKKRKPKVKT